VAIMGQLRGAIRLPGYAALLGLDLLENSYCLLCHPKDSLTLTPYWILCISNLP
jgi:hypothetical protein